MVQATKCLQKEKNLTSSESPAAKPNLQQPTHVMKKWEPDRGGNGREKTATPRDEKRNRTEVVMNEKNRTGVRGEPGVVRARADRGLARVWNNIPYPGYEIALPYIYIYIYKTIDTTKLNC
jgi:hypothetical protein